MGAERDGLQALLQEALQALKHHHGAHLPLIQVILERTLAFGIDRVHGGV